MHAFHNRWLRARRQGREIRLTGVHAFHNRWLRARRQGREIRLTAPGGGKGQVGEV